MGYLNQYERTEEVLDAEGWLHSGDLGKHDENDFLFITGRIKGNGSANSRRAQICVDRDFDFHHIAGGWVCECDSQRTQTLF